MTTSNHSINLQLSIHGNGGYGHRLPFRTMRRYP